MSILFISDLHLEPARPDVAQAFFRFMEQQAPHATALYILGDFFEVWVGDDIQNTFINKVKDALRNLTQQGIPVYLMHGNRDFLIGQQFAEETGCQMLADPTLVDMFGHKTLLMHGDTLCTRDTDYLTFRNMVRSPLWQADFLAKPVEERAAIADNIRDISKEKTGQKQYEIMDVTLSEVEKVMTEQGVQLLIHGHTHRPAIHQLQINGKTAERVVLGDWHSAGWKITFTEDGYKLEDFPF
jgi:UDP-2,3-diacylglucosamine hydrolase